MPRHLVRLRIGSLLMLMVAATPALAQRVRPHLIAALGGSALRVGASAEPSGTISAAAVTLGAEQRLDQRWSAQLLLRALVPTSVESAQPGCVPGAVCQSRSSPSQLLSASLHLERSTASRALGASIGAGVLSARETEPGPRGASFGDVGVTWRPAVGRRASLELRMHAAILSRRVSGMRTFLLPTIGVSL